MVEYHLNENAVKNLCTAFLQLKSQEEMKKFLLDLCTPREIHAMAERWEVCQLLNDNLSYRKIHRVNGASLATIGRVSHFLRNEKHCGYKCVLERSKSAGEGGEES
jgi:TrpR-related protein YerC/YecD